MLPSTRDRVPIHTASQDKRSIEQNLKDSLFYYAQRPSKIEERLKELDDEWDIERAIEMNASALAFAGIMAGIFYDKRWFLLPATVSAFLFQHAIQGWCPPVPVFRKLGFRTVYEIDQERYALKALRGDFKSVSRRRVNTRSRPAFKRKLAKTAKRSAAA